jgi:hydroxyacylglutathione hydrolase
MEYIGLSNCSLLYKWKICVNYNVNINKRKRLFKLKPIINKFIYEIWNISKERTVKMNHKESIEINTVTVGPFATNCYLISDPDTSEAVFIDPGAETKRLINKVNELNLDLKFIIVTHCHIDHIADSILIQEYFNVPFYIHEEELPLLESLQEQAFSLGLNYSGIPKDVSFIKEGNKIRLGKLSAKILHTPGHSPGGISVLFDGHVFVGDLLFKDSIGRSDLYKGNFNQIMHSIKTKLLALDDNTKVYPGHGPATTIGRERKKNPFLQDEEQRFSL